MYAVFIDALVGLRWRRFHPSYRDCDRRVCMVHHRLCLSQCLVVDRSRSSSVPNGRLLLWYVGNFQEARLEEVADAAGALFLAFSLSCDAHKE